MGTNVCPAGITDWFGLGGTLKIIWFQPPARSRDISHQPRVLRAPSNLALSPAREGAAPASLGSLGQGLTTLLGKKFFLISNPVWWLVEQMKMLRRTRLWYKLPWPLFLGSTRASLQPAEPLHDQFPLKSLQEATKPGFCNSFSPGWLPGG